MRYIVSQAWSGQEIGTVTVQDNRIVDLDSDDPSHYQLLLSFMEIAEDQQGFDGLVARTRMYHFVEAT